jgi:hypothetical protein
MEKTMEVTTLQSEGLIQENGFTTMTALLTKFTKSTCSQKTIPSCYMATLANVFSCKYPTLTF